MSEAEQQVVEPAMDKESPVSADNVVISEPAPTEQVAESANSDAGNGKVAAEPEKPRTIDGDKYCETSDSVTWVKDAAVKVRYEKSGMPSVPAMTVMSMFKSTCQKYGNHRALAYKDGANWNYITYNEYYSRICAAAKSFIKVGLEPYNGVGILGFNSKEWFISNFGAIFAGGLGTGIYTTNSADAVGYVLESSNSNVCVVENDVQLQKVLQVWENLPSLKAIVQYTGKPSTDKPNVYSWDDFMKLGEDVPDSDLQARMDAQYVNKCCALIYTSGTTGKPKGVMLSHDNATYSANVVSNATQIRLAQEVIISYLPLSHIAGQMLDMYAPVAKAATIYFAKPDALKGSLNETMKEVNPTIFLGVPRVYEKMEEKLKVGLSAITGIKKKLVDWARGTATKTAINMTRGQGPAFGMSIANRLFKNLREQLGLTNCKWLYSGAAPLSEETHNFFSSLGLPIMEVYGMSECCGLTTMSVWSFTNKHWKPGSAGYRMQGISYELADKDEKGQGEIVNDGRNIFMGYLNEEGKTLDAFDEQYRLKSGDVGRIDPDGFLFITGRIKELLITAGGENVAPVPIEDAVKAALPQVSNCMLIGDKRKFLSMLISLKTEVDLETMTPKDTFTDQTIEWCRSVGSNATKVSDVTDNKDEAVNKAIQTAIDQVNKKSESNAKKISKFAILPQDFSIPGGELGPTLKLKRPVATEKHSALIDSIYNV